MHPTKGIIKMIKGRIAKYNAAYRNPTQWETSMLSDAEKAFTTSNFQIRFHLRDMLEQLKSSNTSKFKLGVKYISAISVPLLLLSMAIISKRSFIYY